MCVLLTTLPTVKWLITNSTDLNFETFIYYLLQWVSQMWITALNDSVDLVLRLIQTSNLFFKWFIERVNWCILQKKKKKKAYFVSIILRYKDLFFLITPHSIQNVNTAFTWLLLTWLYSSIVNRARRTEVLWEVRVCQINETMYINSIHSFLTSWTTLISHHSDCTNLPQHFIPLL